MSSYGGGRYANLSQEERTAHQKLNLLTRYRRFATNVGWLHNGVYIVIIVLLALLLAKTPPVPDTGSAAAPNVTINCAATFTYDNATCNRSTDCLQGLLNTDGLTCTYLPRPSSVINCSSACYPYGETRCDAAGECTGDAAACFGTCTVDNDCDVGDKFQLNENLLYNAAQPSLWAYSGWYESFGCWYGSCVIAILDIFAGSNTFPLFLAPPPADAAEVPYNFTNLAVHNKPQDYFMPDYVEMYKDCLTFSESLLSTGLINYNLFGNGGYGNTTFPFQLRVTTVSFSCAQPYQAVVPDKRRQTYIESVRAIPYKSREEWGFTPVHASADDDVPPIRDPTLRNAFYAQLHDKMLIAVPQYLDALFNATSK